MDKVLEYTQDSTINKLKLLFLLDKMEIPLTENNIIDICTSRTDKINLPCIISLQASKKFFILMFSVSGYLIAHLN